jgi:hypothetical protein
MRKVSWQSLVYARSRARCLRILGLSVSTCLLLTTIVISVQPLTSSVRAASSGQPNTFDPSSNASSINNLPPEPAPGANPTPGVPTPFAKSALFPMTPAVIALDPNSPSHFVGSDGRFQIDVPAGAISPSDVAADGGATSLLVRQILPASGSNAGGSGHYSFGSYLIQVTNSAGQLASHGLQQPVTLTMHYGASSALDVAHAYLVINAPVPPSVNLDPTSVNLSTPNPTGTSTAKPSRSAVRPFVTSPSPHRQLAGLARWTAPIGQSVGVHSARLATLDPAAGTLSGSAPFSSPSMSASWGTNSPVATFGKPSPFETDLSGGSLTAQYNIDVPAGPKGFKPPLGLIYNSAGVAGQHNPQGAAGWVGEGWNLTLGSISWAEHNTNGSGTPNWQNSWELSDAYGTSAALIPPNVYVSTSNDDTGRTITASPLRWHTAPETYAKVYSIYVPFNWPPLYGAVPPCFRVFLRSGIMEEFGCTLDSLQYYFVASRPNTPYIANWLLDLITEPDGNQIHISYQQDVAGNNTIRDAVMNTIEWDSPYCYGAASATTACLTAAQGGTQANHNLWAPQMRVSFDGNHHFLDANHTSGVNCGAGSGNLRCDDPADLSGSGGIAAPVVQSDFVLYDINVQVLVGSPTTWHTLRDYRLSYDQGGPTTIVDPLSGLNESTAGRLNLTRLAMYGDSGSSPLLTTAFTYGQFNEYYEDSLLFPTPRTNCGPSWNTGTGSGCILWSQSRNSNSFYLTAVSNGLGLNQTFNWQQLRDNMHGVYSGSDNGDPFYCTNQQGSQGSNTSFPCNMELTRFGGHPDTWDHESHKEVRCGPQVYPRVPTGVPC